MGFVARRVLRPTQLPSAETRLRRRSVRMFPFFDTADTQTFSTHVSVFPCPRRVSALALSKACRTRRTTEGKRIIRLRSTASPAAHTLTHGRDSPVTVNVVAHFDLWMSQVSLCAGPAPRLQDSPFYGAKRKSSGFVARRVLRPTHDPWQRLIYDVIGGRAF